jgi:hypothetical protein
MTGTAIVHGTTIVLLLHPSVAEHWNGEFLVGAGEQAISDGSANELS